MSLKVGDTITCHDLDDLIRTMVECARAGIETDFDYSGDKPNLIVTVVKGDNNERVVRIDKHHRRTKGVSGR